MPRLFDRVTRTYLGPADYSEPKFGWLNRSARPEVAHARKLLERWFYGFPKEGKKDLHARFRSSDDRQHIAAFFELYIYALLRCHGYKIALHESIDPTKSTRFDFLVRAHGRPILVLECIASFGSGANQSERSKLNQLYDALNQVHSPDYFFSLNVETVGSGAPSISRIKAFLQQKLEQLRSSSIGTQASVAGIKWAEDGWELEFDIFSRSGRTRGKPGVRPLGATVSAQWVDARKPLLRSAESKAGRYGELGLPYVIALNTMDGSVDEIDIRDMLFGQEIFLMDRKTLQMRASRASATGFVVSRLRPTT